MEGTPCILRCSRCQRSDLQYGSPASLFTKWLRSQDCGGESCQSLGGGTTHSVCGNSVTQEAKGQPLFIDSVLAAPGLSLGILTGFQGPASPPLLSGNTGTAVLSCQTGLDIGLYALRPSPIRKILRSSTVVGRGFLKT